MIIHRPHRSTLDQAMKKKREFYSLKDCLETLIKEHNDKYKNIFNITLNDLAIEYYGTDERIKWKDVFIICCKPYEQVHDKKGYELYFGDKYSHSLQLFGFFSTDYNI